MMLYTKYESSGPCSFRQEDFLKFHLNKSRSPEEKFKGQGEAIYRGPLMLSTKYL